MISDLDVPHRLCLSAIVELPFGKGRRFLSDASGFVNALIGGWQIQGVYTYQSGFPVPFGSYNLNTGVTSGDLFYNGGDIAINDPTIDQWFNTDAFTSILNGLVDERDAGQPPADAAVPVRRRPPGLHQQRRPVAHQGHPIKGDVRLQLRAEFINAFNEAYFPNPVVSATSSTFGQVTASNQSNYARRAQIGVKLLF